MTKYLTNIFLGKVVNMPPFGCVTKLACYLRVV